MSATTGNEETRNAVTDTARSIGQVTITVTDKDGNIKSRQTTPNQITDAGDLYHASRIRAGVLPAGGADVPKITGMKLGTGTTTPAKSGAGAALVSYINGSNVAIDAAFPTVTSLGPGLGSVITYQTTFVAGVATNAAITEMVLVTDSATDLTSVAANTVARLVYAATPKAATDQLTISWTIKQLG